MMINFIYKIDKIRFRIVFILWILIGFMVPIWIGLSLVYRSPLPYENIKILNQVQITEFPSFLTGLEDDCCEDQRGLNLAESIIQSRRYNQIYSIFFK